MKQQALASAFRGTALALSVLGVLGGGPASRASADAARAPAFRVRDLEGNPLELEALLEKGPVLVDFWATWCKPCLASLPELESWHQEFGPRGLTVVGVSVDGPRNHAKVRPFRNRMGLTYPIALDRDGRLQQSYQVVALPTAFLIDPSGTIASVRIGYRPGEGEEMEEKIRGLLLVKAAADSAARNSSAAPAGSTPRGSTGS